MRNGTRGSGMTWVGRCHPVASRPSTHYRSGPIHRQTFLPHIGYASCAAPVAAGKLVDIRVPTGAMVITAADLGGVKKITPMLHKFAYKPVGQTTRLLKASFASPASSLPRSWHRRRQRRKISRSDCRVINR